MDTLPYLLGFLLAALAAVGLLSAALTRYQRRHDFRRVQAERLLHALHRYSEWVREQRLAAVFQGEGRDAAAALDDACTIRLAWFPALGGDMAELMAVHNRLLNFLATQHALWLRDPEGWLASDHDGRFMALWRQHRIALHALSGRLQEAASLRVLPALPSRSTYA
jgi:hypothetical protein